MEDAKKCKEKITKDYSRMYFELTYSYSASIGFRVGGININHWGGYGKIQTTFPSPIFIEKNSFPKNHGVKSSISAGPMYAITSWLYLYLGGGIGFYKDSLYQANSKTGGELEGGLQFNAKGFSVSTEVSYCKIGLQKSYWDYNIGIGFNNRYKLQNKWWYLAYNFDLGNSNLNFLFSKEESIYNKGLIGFSFGLLKARSVGFYVSYLSNVYPKMSISTLMPLKKPIFWRINAR